MRTLTKDENANRAISIDGKNVKCVHTVKTGRDEPVRYELTWTFDFGEVNADELLELAVRNVLIRTQQDWRAAKDRMKEEKWDNKTFSVRGILDETRKSADPFARAKAAAGKLSKEEREALIKELQG